MARVSSSRMLTQGCRGSGGRRTRQSVQSFVLLEVIVSMLIVGIALAAVLRSYTNALKALSSERTVTTAVLIAQALLEDFETDLPEEERVEATCEPDFPNFHYVADFENVEIKYRDIDVGFEAKDFVPMKKVTLRIYHQRRNSPSRERVIFVETYLTGLEKYNRRTRNAHALY